MHVHGLTDVLYMIQRSRSPARSLARPSLRRQAAWLSLLLIGGAAAWQAKAQDRGTGVQAEAAAPRENNLRMRLSSVQVQQAFHHIDRNRDGQLTRSEVSVYPRIERHFERIDADHDGRVSPAEFEQALQQAS
jgi:hypothetical protein